MYRWKSQLYTTIINANNYILYHSRLTQIKIKCALIIFRTGIVVFTSTQTIANNSIICIYILSCSYAYSYVISL